MSSKRNYQLVQARGYLDREGKRKLCKTNASATSSMIIGFFVLLASCFGYVVFLLANPEGILWSPAANFILAIVTVGYYIFKIGWKGDASPKTALSFDPKGIFRSQVFDFINAVIFIVSFFGFFLCFGEVAVNIIVSIMMVILLGAMIYNFDEQQKVYLSNKVFGKSEIEILSPNLRLGETISIQFLNDMLQESVFEVEVILRNLREDWVTKKVKDKTTSTVVTTIFYEEKHTVQIIGDRFDLDFEVPEGIGKATDYKINNPTYWELEVYNKEVDYYSRFFIEILPADEVVFEKEFELKLAEKVQS